MLETTYSVQIQHTDGTWDYYSQAEYSEGEARKLAGEIYGGQVPTRLVKVERSVAE